MAAQIITASGAIATGYVGASGQPANTVVPRSMILAGAATIRALYVTTQDPTGGGSVTVTTRKNGAATTQTVTISAGDDSGADVTHSVSCVAGDVIDWTVAQAGGGVATTVSISVEMD